VDGGADAGDASSPGGDSGISTKDAAAGPEGGQEGPDATGPDAKGPGGVDSGGGGSSAKGGSGCGCRVGSRAPGSLGVIVGVAFLAGLVGRRRKATARGLTT
jgi:MYXO-CTERM domain-containing protein